MEPNLTNLKLIVQNDALDYKPYCAYEEYEGLYDDMAYRIKCIGIINNEIVLSRDYDELTNRTYQTSVPTKCILGCETMNDILNSIEYLQEVLGNADSQIKFKSYDGKVNIIKELIVDRVLKRFVFVSEFDL